MFEASVGGGIPIIRPLLRCITADEVLEISGILNGTTNFILTRMYNEGSDFAPTLKQAQELGYAEADPTADVEGHDACRKICILGSLAYGKHIYPEHVHCSGISRITLEDVEYASNYGCSIKLIGTAKPVDDDKVTAIVCPRLVPRDNLLSSVDDVYNAISVTGDGVGDVLFYGRGAGKLPTASAVVGDIIDCLKHPGRVIMLSWEDCTDDGYVVPYKTQKTAMYVRIKADSAELLKPFIDELIGEAVYLDRSGRPANELAFITPAYTESVLDEKLAELSEKASVESKIRMF